VYLAFYGLKEKPFSSTPDPRFLYLTSGHREALAQLMYGLREQKGFIVLTGEVGTGKTTLIQALLKQLDGSTAVAHVFNSSLSFDGLLEYMLEEFGIGQSANTKAQQLLGLKTFLIARRRTSQQSLLVVDEAQNLDPSTLEQIRLLSNFETPTEKLLQIILAGQPELKTKLELPELRQLHQRIDIRCRIASMSAHDTRAYIRNRLVVAGASDLGVFSDRAITRIAAYTGGVPRLVNILCDHCLLIGYADQKRQIGPDVVEEAIAVLDERRRRRVASGLTQPPPRRLRWLMASAATVLVASAVLLAGLHADATHLRALDEVVRVLRDWVAK
jgi:general secretion pathway protein A